MANKILLEVASSAAGVQGDAQGTKGDNFPIQISATSYGTDGKIVIKGSADGSVYTTLSDPNTASGLAEYDADTIIKVDRLAQSWKIRADLEISAGTATGVKVVMGAN